MDSPEGIRQVLVAFLNDSLECNFYFVLVAKLLVDLKTHLNSFSFFVVGHFHHQPLTKSLHNLTEDELEILLKKLTSINIIFS